MFGFCKFPINNCLLCSQDWKNIKTTIKAESLPDCFFFSQWMSFGQNLSFFSALFLLLVGSKGLIEGKHARYVITGTSECRRRKKILSTKMLALCQLLTFAPGIPFACSKSRNSCLSTHVFPLPLEQRVKHPFLAVNYNKRSEMETVYRRFCALNIKEIKARNCNTLCL